MGALKSSEIVSGEIILENMFSKSVFEWLVSQVGCKI